MVSADSAAGSFFFFGFSCKSETMQKAVQTIVVWCVAFCVSTKS